MLKGLLSSKNQAEKEWDLVVTPQKNIFDWKLRYVWDARELIALFVWRDFISVYKQTILGPFWYLLQPTLQTLMYFVIFGLVARLPTGNIPPLVFYLSGTVLWGFFSSSISRVSNTFLSNTSLFGKVYFPRLVIPISVVISNFVSFLIQITFLVVVMAIYIGAGSTIRPTLWLAATPILLLMVASLGFGFGIIISALTVRYRDLHYFVGFAVQFLLYTTPVVYQVSILPPSLRWIVSLNPLTPIVEAFRLALLGQGDISLPQLAYSLTVTIVTLIISLIAFNRVEGTVMDYV
jgi:lipopolysaccharide transport system permease protein